MTTPGRSRLSLLIATTAGILLVLEAVGRWAIPGPPTREDQLVADVELGWALPREPQMNWRGTLARINRLGLRGRTPLDDPQATRILVVGDSSVFGDGVRDSQTLPDQLAQRLESRHQADVQNGGVPGYTCTQSTTLIARLTPDFQPDVLVSYNMHSDFRRASPDDRVMTQRKLGPLANTGVGRLIATGTLWMRIWRQRPNLEAPAYQTCLDAMVRTQTATGGRMVLVIPFNESDFPQSAHYGMEEPDPPGTRLADYRTSMRQVAARSGSLLVDGPAVLLASGLKKDEALQDMVHPTARGHAVLAAAIDAAMWPSEE